MRRWLEDWNKLNPVLADGEVGEIIGTLVTKTGDGKSPWKDLSFTHLGLVVEGGVDFATSADVNAAIADLVGTAPELLNTLGEIDTLLATKADLVDGKVPADQLPPTPVVEVTQAELDAVASAKQDIATLPEAVQDIVGAALVAGTNMAVSYDDTVGTVTLDATAAATSYAQERVTITDDTDLTYILSHTPVNTEALLVYLNGVLLQSTVDYTLSAATVTFAASVIVNTDIVTFVYPYGA